MIININNKFIEKKNANISILSEAFMYGYGVFETLRTYDKKIFKLDEHINRLFNSAKQIDLKINYNEKKIKKIALEVVKKSKYKIQKLKIVAVKQKIIIISQKLSINEKIYNGVKCIFIKNIRAIPEVKSISYLSSYISHQKATNKGFYEAILLNEKNQVTEGAYSNLFWFEGNILCTNNQNVLKGITADTIIKKSPFKIRFKSLNKKDLLKKQEAFLTQTTTGIVPIIQINNIKINEGKVGENTRKLMRTFFSDLPDKEK